VEIVADVFMEPHEQAGVNPENLGNYYGYNISINVLCTFILRGCAA